MTDTQAGDAGVVDFDGGQRTGGRPYQEDTWYAGALGDDGAAYLLVVADGMGGEAGGAEASRIATECFVAAVAEAFGHGDSDRELLAGALDEANRALDRTRDDRPELDGFGCTLVAALLRPDAGTLHWVSVGDSPLWLVRDGRVERLNADHSMAPVLDELVEIGRMTAAEARHDRRRNQLRSALTGEEIAKRDLPGEPLELAYSDVLLLASDGLDTLAPERLGEVPPTGPAAHTVATLLDAVEAAGRDDQDNVTVVAAHCFVRRAAPNAGADTAPRRGWRRWFGRAADK